jgi:putative NADH-flavin reductase
VSTHTHYQPVGFDVDHDCLAYCVGVNIFLLGATGRVGKEFLQLALAAGHTVSALVRDPSKVAASPSLMLFTGDIYDDDALRSSFRSGTWDAVVNLIGTDPLKPSTVVTDAARALVALCHETQTSRYLAISGTAEMPHTRLGGITLFIMRRTPVGHGIRDHDGALDIVASSSLDWALVCCPWIKDGPGLGTYTTADTFPGGMKSIHPADVALAVFREFEAPAHHQQIFGIWH